ncbi:MAG: NAD(+) diphosphatase [Betaproteobacteria bacterium]|jgi:NAD+ diphosphatase|nr:NAD(+) diphosphatase [Rhodocyclaceae bacterium]MCA3134854.1 NAD(+) diphosphatase [Rhodocyclaceae bacterium]MCA3142336.1 NAD(+) diphosphatase [Rhodocyclaceae bacterium]MCA3146375.1 NAD(+) diphosphatase [Rhodocyclaceae bacterium]MCE2898319.1 NAD(+) diphosphatase [Betaproteobacteria bacterium]
MQGRPFVALLEAPALHRGASWWFVFRGSNLLVKRDAAGAQLPFVTHPEDLGLEPLRTHYLGTSGPDHVYVAEVAEDSQPPAAMQWSGLRALFGLLDDTTFSLAGRAVQIVDWDRSHQFCGRCGSGTERKAGERSRVCAACGQAHYPRLAPVAMALVRRGRELLLARSPHFPPGMMSALAGFVEPGESLEECLVREVREEVGVEVRNLRYFSSQPWPFPHSLMVAFHCEWASGHIVCQEGEIEDAGWFSPEALPVLPNRVSIARRLIEDALRELHGRP